MENPLALLEPSVLKRIQSLRERDVNAIGDVTDLHFSYVVVE